jgi:hypothetical protein
MIWTGKIRQFSRTDSSLARLRWPFDKNRKITSLGRRGYSIKVFKRGRSYLRLRIGADLRKLNGGMKGGSDG